MIFVIGEILMDMVGNSAKTSLQVEGKLGGAPFNVASNLADLGIKTYFHGVIGKDIIGNFLSNQLKDHKDNLHLLLSQKEDKTTTIAFFLKDQGDFQFLRKCGADYSFDIKNLLSFPYKDAKIIHFGSLFLSNEQARNTIFSTVEEYKKSPVLISFDVNFREDIFKKDEDYLSYYKKMISFSDIIKFTKDELEMLSGEKELEKALKQFTNHKIILITDGENGSYCYYHSKLYFKKANKVQPVDTIGCGDSFMAGALSYLHQKNIDNLQDEDIEKLLSRGNECGRRTCLVQGAIHGYNSLEELEK